MTSEKLRLELQPRELTGKKVKNLRRDGLLPVAVCGKGVEPYSAQVNERDFMQILRRAGSTTLVELRMPDQEPQQAFIHEIQRHPVTRRLIHADFHVVDLLKNVTVQVPVTTTGENSLVERGDGILNIALSMLEVRCLPRAMPHQITLDISNLTDFQQTIHVRDINLGEDIHILTPPDELVISITPTRMAAEDEALAEETAEPELVRDDRRSQE